MGVFNLSTINRDVYILRSLPFMAVSKLMELTSSSSSPEVCDQDAKEYEVSYRDGKKYEVCDRNSKEYEYEVCNQDAKKKNKGLKLPLTPHEYEVCDQDVKEYEVSYRDGKMYKVCDQNSKEYEVCNQDAKKKKNKGLKLPWTPYEDKVCDQDAKEYEVSYHDGKKYEVYDLKQNSKEYEVCNRDAKKKNKGLKLPWTSHQDEMLRALVKRYGAQRWSKICKEIPERSAKSCRLRWFNHLLPGLNLSRFTPEEDAMIIDLYRIYGTRWATIARQMSGRSDNAIKNRWNCSLKNRQENKPMTDTKRSNNDSDGHFGSKAHRINVAESCKSSKSLPKTLENIEADTCKRDGESCKPSKSETCKQHIELWKPPQELNLLSPGISQQVFDTQQDFTGFKIDHGIDDPITKLTLCFPDYGKLLQ